MPVHTEQQYPTQNENRSRVILRRTLSRLGAVGAMGCFGALIALPITVIGMRADNEQRHAEKAREDTISAVLAFTGSSLLDKSTEKSVLLQKFTDNDTIAVRTGDPDPIRAHEFLMKASQELSGSTENPGISDGLAKLASAEDVRVTDVISLSDRIKTHVPNGDVITPIDLGVEGGVLVGLVASAALYSRNSPRQS